MTDILVACWIVVGSQLLRLNSSVKYLQSWMKETYYNSKKSAARNHCVILRMPGVTPHSVTLRTLSLEKSRSTQIYMDLSIASLSQSAVWDASVKKKLTLVCLPKSWILRCFEKNRYCFYPLSHSCCPLRSELLGSSDLPTFLSLMLRQSMSAIVLDSKNGCLGLLSSLSSVMPDFI